MTATGSGAPFEITRSTGRCAATDRELAPGDRVRTVLLDEDPSAPLRRLDYLDPAPGTQPAPVGPAGRVVATWRWVVPASRGRGRLLLDDDALFQLFESLEGAEGRQAAFRYLLALMLMRRRALALERAERDDSGARTLVLRGRGRFGEGRAPWSIPEPEMDDAAIEEALGELSLVLADEGPA